VPHPRIPDFADLRRCPAPAGSLDYRLPAEWEPQSCVYLALPRLETTWPGVLEAAIAQHEALIEALRRVTPVCMLDALDIPTDDAWVRDYGPIFVVHSPHQAEDEPRPKRLVSPDPDAPPPSPPDPANALACHDFHFANWGGKYGPAPNDDVVPQHIARHLDLRIWVHDWTLEGGAIDTDGRGTLLTTRQCLLNPNRFADATTPDREQIEQQLHDTLGITRVIWLPGGIAGDDTDGHVDDVARFIAPYRVAAVAAPPGHPDHDITRRNLSTLAANKLDVVQLPAPDPIHHDYPADDSGPAQRRPVPASYANFLISNGRVFLPTFSQPTDDLAARALDDAMPGHTIVPLPAEALVVGLGAFHCLTMQQPAVLRAAEAAR
jgi:agmatine deiminase